MPIMDECKEIAQETLQVHHKLLNFCAMASENAAVQKCIAKLAGVRKHQQHSPFQPNGV